MDRSYQIIDYLRDELNQCFTVSFTETTAVDIKLENGLSIHRVDTEVWRIEHKGKCIYEKQINDYDESLDFMNVIRISLKLTEQ